MPDSTPEWNKVDEFLDKKKEVIPMYTPITFDEFKEQFFYKVADKHAFAWIAVDAAQRKVKSQESELSELRESNRRQGEEIERLRLENRKLELQVCKWEERGIKAMLAHLFVRQDILKALNHPDPGKDEEIKKGGEHLNAAIEKSHRLEAEIAELESQLQLLNKKGNEGDAEK